MNGLRVPRTLVKERACSFDGPMLFDCIKMYDVVASYLILTVFQCLENYLVFLRLALSLSLSLSLSLALSPYTVIFTSYNDNYY